MFVAGVLGSVLDFVKQTKTSVARVFARADASGAWTVRSWFVYTCRRLIDLSVIAGTGDLDTLELQVSHLLIYQAPACSADLSSAGMFC